MDIGQIINDNNATELEKLEGKYLTFTISDEDYGIQIKKVKEIIVITDITVVPHTPAYIKGVINLRGKVIPVMDLRLKFGFKERKHDERACIIVVEVQGRGQAGIIQVGVLVDSVSEVLNIFKEQIEPAPEFGAGSGIDTANILGLGKINGKVKILLDLDHVIGNEAIEQL